MLLRGNNGWNEFDDMFQVMDQLRSQMDRFASEVFVGRVDDGRAAPVYATSWPRANLVDAGSALVLAAEVPGMSDRDVRISLNQDVLTISGVRRVSAPDGYRVHRQERGALEFSRSFALPCRVDPDRTTATVKDGILTVTLEKTPDAMPRQIAIKSA